MARQALTVGVALVLASTYCLVGCVSLQPPEPPVSYARQGEPAIVLAPTEIWDQLVGLTEVQVHKLLGQPDREETFLVHGQQGDQRFRRMLELLRKPGEPNFVVWEQYYRLGPYLVYVWLKKNDEGTWVVLADLVLDPHALY